VIVPGSNILNMALSVLGKQSFQYYAFASRTPNAVGQDIATYAAPLALQGSVQPVPRELFERYGLDFQRNYVNVYVSKNVLDVTRDVSGDLIVFNGKPYQCVSETPWAAIDGWDAVLCVQVPDSSLP
jgi:hypothetical protein